MGLVMMRHLSGSKGRAAIYIRLSGGTELIRDQEALFELASDLGLEVFEIYVDREHDDFLRRNAMLQQLLTDCRNNCFGTVIRLSSTYQTFDRDILVHSFGMLAAKGVRIITLGGQYGNKGIDA